MRSAPPAVRQWITPAAAILALALIAVALTVLLLVQGHPIAAMLLLVAALCQFGLSGEAARYRRDTHGLAWTSPLERFRRHRELRRLRAGLARQRAGRAGPLLALGDAVYRGDAEASDEALFSIRTLDGRIAETEARMQTLERRHIPATGLEPAPEPSPEPSQPIEPPLIPEPLPEPHVPPEIPTIPEPVPVPSEPLPAAGLQRD